jgi:hypothetical protein
MKIGILGPPGAGKTKFANRLRRLMAQEDDNASVTVVDGYAQRIQRDTGLALGPWANWSESYMVAGYRRVQELRARKNYTHVITVGTILDTVYYCGLAAESFDVYGDSQSKIATASAMAGAGIWLRSDWDYDLGFILIADEGDDWVKDYGPNMVELTAMNLGTNFFVARAKDFTDDYLKPLLKPAAPE